MLLVMRKRYRNKKKAIAWAKSDQLRWQKRAELYEMETELKSSSEPEKSEVSDLAVEDELSQWFSPNTKPGGTESDDRYINVQKDFAADGTHLFFSMQALKQIPMHVHTQGIEINCAKRARTSQL